MNVNASDSKGQSIEVFGSFHEEDVTFDFLPYGVEHGDTMLSGIDDGSSDGIILTTDVRIFGSTQTQLFVSFLYSIL